MSGDFSVAGSTQGAGPVHVVVDGDLATAATATPDATGRWRQATVDTSRMVDAGVAHTVTAWAEGAAAAPAQTFRVARAWQTVADVDDPAGDDTGASGRYLYPTDPGWGDKHLLDLRRLRVATAGGALRLDVGLAQISTSWNPANGFDHVALTVYIQLPGRDDGATVMPLQDATLPEGMRWHLRLRVHGWSNALFGPQGASATQEGTPLTPGAAVQVDAGKRTISLTLPAAALGRLPSLSGAKGLVTTWDYDGGYRALAPEAQPFAWAAARPVSPRSWTPAR